MYHIEISWQTSIQDQKCKTNSDDTLASFLVPVAGMSFWHQLAIWNWTHSIRCWQPALVKIQYRKVWHTDWFTGTSRMVAATGGRKLSSVSSLKDW